MSIELIRGELERLYSLEEMLALSRDLLGFDPENVGGTASPASFARALTGHCQDRDAIGALIDAVTTVKPTASPKLRKFVTDVLRAPVTLRAGDRIGTFTILRKIGTGPNATTYLAKEQLPLPATAPDEPGSSEDATKAKAVDAAEAKKADSKDGEDGKADAKDGKADAKDGKADAKDGKADAKDGKADAKDDEADAKDDEADAKDGEADAKDGQASADDQAASAEKEASPAEETPPKPSEPPPTERDVVLKLLHASSTHDKGGVHRFLTRNRLICRIEHDNLPTGVTAGFADGTPYVAYEPVEANSLASRIARTGALHINEARVLLHGILEAIGAIHKEGMVHGAVKLENVLVAKNADGTPRPVVVDAGGDALSSAWIYSDVATTGGGRIKGLAPELLQWLACEPQADMYAFGALLFEVLTGRAPLEGKTAMEVAIAHQTKQPPDPRKVAPKGWVSEELAELCLSLLAKEAGKRPTIDKIMEIIGPSGPLSSKDLIPEAELNDCIDALVADPTDHDAAIALELTLDRGASPRLVAEAFLMAADQVDLDSLSAEKKADEESDAVAEAQAEAALDRARETKKGLIFRAARLFESQLKDFQRAEDAYKWLLEVGPGDAVARAGYESALSAQDKHEELVESLLDIGQNAPNHSDRARALNKIGQIYAGPLEDTEQAVFAFAQALAQDIQNEEYADDVERAAGDNMNYWADVMRSLHEVSEHPRMPQEVRIELFMRLGTWYHERINRADLALRCFERVVAVDPAHDAALGGMASLYRRAQQWNELVTVLKTHIDRAATPERARDYRAEAAELLETRLDDVAGAKELYEETLKEDPGHQKTVEALARIYQRDENWTGLVAVLERQAEALAGAARADVLCRIGEMYEEKLNDLTEAERCFQLALDFDGGSMSALRAMDRLLSRSGRYAELLDNLLAQARVAATPRQKISLFERMAGIHEEEFLDHAAAAEALEKVLELDGAHEGALTALMPHYRAMSRWDEVTSLYERTLEIVTDDARRIELLLALGRVLLEQVGSPERARQAYERVLEADPNHPSALESLAHVRAATGDAMAALKAVESLAQKADTPDSKADLWIRAAAILEEHGDRDGAIERYRAALDAKADHMGAIAALRAAYLARGDGASAADILQREIEHTDGELAQARLYCELAELYRDKLNTPEDAKDAAAKAQNLDPTNTTSLVILGDMAFDAESFLEAAKHYAKLSNRIEAFEQDEGKRILMRYIDSLARSGSTEEAHSTVDSLLKLAPDEPDAIRRAARVRLDAGDGKGAAELYRDLHERFAADHTDEDRLLIMRRYGKSLRLAGELEAALVPLHEAADLAPDSVEVIDELTKTYEAQENWEEVVRIKKNRLDLAEGEERSEVLLDIGEVLATKIKDPTRAAKSLVAALEERPDDRKVLARLMRLYSEEKDWSKLVEVVLKLAEGIEDPAQKAKYVHTAGVVTWKQIGNLDAAAKYFEEVLDLDPGNEKIVEECIDLREARGDWEEAVEFLVKVMDKAEAADDTAKLVECLDRLAGLYEERLGDMPSAVECLERADGLDPENAERTERLSNLYGGDLDSYLDKAVGGHFDLIEKNPFDAQAYRSLRKIFTEAKQADAAWCLCQALHCMNVAEPDEERFFRRMRPETAATARTRVTEEDWIQVLMHPELDGRLTAVFTIIEPAVIQKNSQPMETLGFQPAYALDLSMHPYPMSQTLYYAGGVLGMDLPLTFQNTNDPGGISFLHGRPPAIVLGQAALAAELPTQAAAFIAARHLTFYRPGLYIRQLVPTGTGLRSWLFAAIRLLNPDFPLAPEIEATVLENVSVIEPLVTGPLRAQLASAVTKLLQSGPIDLKKWVAAVDLTGDRAGLLLSHDLEVALEMVRASDEESTALTEQDRARDLIVFSVSRDYFSLRTRLGINIDAS